MSLFTDPERRFAEALGRLTYCNPFLPERIECERDALGDAFVPSEAVWSVRPGREGERENVRQLLSRAESLADAARSRLAKNHSATKKELELYEDLILYVLYQRYGEPQHALILRAATDPRSATKKVEAYARYLDDYNTCFDAPGPGFTPRYPAPQLFANFFQIRRAFHYIFRHIVGGSMPAARLRAAVWQSIFTNDLRRYFRVLYDRMADFTTLVVGPSGTGKELVARAVALSRFIPFDPKTHSFADDFTGSFHALNLTALSPTLIESELFGHRRGAFTGAIEDRAGWLEVCRPLGTVFLDEVGEIDAGIQVKLLRVLQSRVFQRLGDTQPKTFTGKIIAATNRDLAAEMQAGRIREDFYYRLCSDQITTPALRDILRESPDELAPMVRFICQRVFVPHDAGARHASPSSTDEADAFAEEVTAWIHRSLGKEYPWPGNFRELEQCVRNVLIRGEYRPTLTPPKDLKQELLTAIWSGALTADDLLKRYCTIVQSQTNNYEETARRLDIDRRTVKAKVDENLMSRLR